MLHWVRTVVVTTTHIEFREGKAVVNTIAVKPGLFDKLQQVRTDWERGQMSSLDLFAALGPFKRN